MSSGLETLLLSIEGNLDLIFCDNLDRGFEQGSTKGPSGMAIFSLSKELECNGGGWCVQPPVLRLHRDKTVSCLLDGE